MPNRICRPLLFPLMILFLLGCQKPVDPVRGRTIDPLAGSRQVSIPGPSELRPDGSVRDTRLNRPNGRLLRVCAGTDLRHHQVEAWARNEAVMVAADSGLSSHEVIGWMQIRGPRNLQLEDGLTTTVYDVRLEIWKPAASPIEREREVQ